MGLATNSYSVYLLLAEFNFNKQHFSPINNY